MASITSILKRARTSGGWGGWSGLSGVDYVNDSGLYVVYGIGLSMSAGEVLNSVQVSTNFVAPQTSSNPSTVTCYLYASDPTGYASPPGGMIASSSQSFNASAAGNYITFSFGGLGLSATTMVYAWFVCSTTYTSYGSNQIYHYSTGNGYTYTPTAYVGASGGSSGGGDSGGGTIGGPTTGDNKLYNIDLHTAGMDGIASVSGGGDYYSDTWLEIEIEVEHGYKFEGWYEYDETAEGGYGRFLTDSTWMTHIVTGDWDIIPKVTKQPESALRKVKILFASNVISAEIQINWGDKLQITSPYELDLYVGDLLSVYAETSYGEYFYGGDLIFDDGTVQRGSYFGNMTHKVSDNVAIVLRSGTRNQVYYITPVAGSNISSVDLIFDDDVSYVKPHDICTLFAYPADGYRFIGWYIGNQLVSTENPYHFEATQNVTIEARAAEEIYVTAECGEGIASVSGTGAYVDGEECTLLANVEQGYDFWGFASGTSTSSFHSLENPYTFIVRKHSLVPFTTARAKIKTFTIKVINNVEGTVRSYTCQYNSTFTAQTSVRAGYEFIGWSVDGTIVSTANPATFTVTGDATLTAVINPIIYTITPVAGEGIASVSGGGNYPHGSSCTISAVPAERYRFTGWKHGSVIRYTTNPATVNVNYSIFGSNKNVVLEAYGYLAYLIANNVWVWNNGGWQKVTPFVWIENAWKKIKTIIFRG